MIVWSKDKWLLSTDSKVYQNPKFENNPEVEIKYEVNTLNNVY